MNTVRITPWLSTGLLGLFALVAMPAAADQVINDDLIVKGSECVGFDCITNEIFDFDTIRLKENNLRIHFDDTSTITGFPRRDWRIIVNDSASGGAEKFSIEDTTAGRVPFTIVGNAPADSLFVSSGGRLGIRTGAPVLDVHIRSGNTPALRLEQDGSSGFTAQTWDVAGNETNFFVRDATSGSRLPLRIQPNSPSNSVFVKASSGNVGMGTNDPQTALDVVRSGSGTTVDIGLRNGSSDWRFQNFNNIFRVTKAGTGAAELELDGSGNLFIRGACSEGGNPGTGNCADYVFEPDYELLPLEDLAAFIALNKHLPNVPSTDDIKQNGVNVQHFQGRLLEKIEELVLYTLEQQRTIDAQQEALATLTTRLAALEESE